ncbi:MAG: hypothetical protein ACP5O0_07300 [Acidimicrobiales bacterium]
MPRYVVRLWLDDRPGALGAVASRIGAVRGDLIGIEILERGAGRAIDELLVELPDASLVDLMIKEITEVDGVDVEDIRIARDVALDRHVELLRVAADLVRSEDRDAIIARLVSYVQRDFEPDWLAVVDLRAGEILAEERDHPSLEWILAFVDGTSYLESIGQGPNDLCWAFLREHPICLLTSRSARPFRAVERQVIGELAGIAGRCLARWDSGT